jgi:hypothetical protein
VLKHHLVMYNNCKVEPLDAANIAGAELEDMLGLHLPDFVYFVLMEGGLRSSVVNPVVSRRLLDHCPWADSLSYRVLLNDLLDLRLTALGLLLDGLRPASCGPDRPFVLQRWYDPHTEVRCVPRVGQQLWQPQLVQDASSDRPATLCSVLQAFAAGGASLTFRSTVLRTDKQILACVIAQALRLLGYAGSSALADEKEKSLLSAFGSAILQAGDVADEPDLAERVLVLVELLRYGHLSGAKLQLPASMEASCACDVSVRFLSRIFSLLPPSKTDGQAWRGKVDADLAGFSCMVQALVSSLRDLFDVLALRLWLDKLVHAAMNDVSLVSSQMPFALDSRCVMGVLMKRLMLAPKAYTLAEAERDFPNLLSIQEDVQRAAAFWSKVRLVIIALATTTSAAAPSSPSMTPALRTSDRHQTGGRRRSSSNLEEAFRVFHLADAFWDGVKRVSPLFSNKTRPSSSTNSSPRKGLAVSNGSAGGWSWKWKRTFHK